MGLVLKLRPQGPSRLEAQLLGPGTLVGPAPHPCQKIARPEFEGYWSPIGTPATTAHPWMHLVPEEIVAGWPYYASKIYQERVAFELAGKLGIEVVVVNPSLLLGPGDRRGSSTGDVLKFLRREIPVVPPGGINFVDARDAAEATVTAMAVGRPGHRYLLGGPNLTMAEYFGRLARVAKVRAPVLRVPERVATAGASLIGHFFRGVLDREPPIDRVSVEMAQVFWYCDSSKARRELSFDPRDPGETLDETVRYLRRSFRI